MKKIVLSNRSQSYLKLRRYQEAEIDADQALMIDQEHLKSLQRRGTARFYLGKYRQSGKDFQKAQSINPSAQIAEYQKKVAEKMEKLKFELLEKMKRKGTASENDTQSDLIKVTVQEINPPAPNPQMPVQGKQAQTEVKKVQEHSETDAKSILKVSSEDKEPSKKKDKKKKKKTKGIDAFMENEEEAKAFAEEVKTVVVEEKPKKAKKSVNFNLDQNTVKEFDKTKKITEVADEEEKETASVSNEKKTIAQTNMDDLVNRTLKKKTSTTTEDIAKLSKSEVVNNALKKSLQTPENGSQFERDYKSLKQDYPAKLEYLLQTVKSESVIKKIFKSSLETDILIDMIEVFSSALPAPEDPSVKDLA